MLCYEVTDRDGDDKMQAGIAENVRFMRDNEHPLIAGTFGLHASLTLNDTALRACADARPTEQVFTSTWPNTKPTRKTACGGSGKRVVHRLNELWHLGR